MRWAGLRHGLGIGVALTVLAAPAGAHAQVLQHDTSLPIEITADRLEVVQPDRIATFTGKVDAVQGEMVLSADQLRVYYYGDQADEPRPAGSGSIRRIEAEGNVFLSSPRETAQGKTGVYDVAGSELTLEGSVVLTQNDNVIRGDRLEIDLVSGHAQVLAALPSSAGGTAPQRVRAIFTPEAATAVTGPAAAVTAPAAAVAGSAAPAAGPAAPGSEAPTAPARPALPTAKPEAAQ